MEILLAVIFFIVCFLKYLEYIEYKDKNEMKLKLISQYDSSRLPPALVISGAKEVSRIGKVSETPNFQSLSNLPPLPKFSLPINVMSFGEINNNYVPPQPSMSAPNVRFDSWHHYENNGHDFNHVSELNDFSASEDLVDEYFNNDLSMSHDSFYDVTLH